MSRYTFLLTSQESRERVCRWIMRAPVNARVDLKEPRRSVEQNARMWAMLTDVSAQLAWHGQKLSPEDWKLMFLAGLNQELRVVPNIAGNGFVQLGRSSSDLSKSEMGDLMDLIACFGAEHGVQFHDGEGPGVAEQAPQEAA